MKPATKTPLHRSRNYAFIILIGILKGLFLVSAVPPWQAADEVTHFEATLLHGSGIASASTTASLEKKILESMDHYSFWKFVGVPAPETMPDGFAHAPFLEASPSKSGRLPTFYALSGRLTAPFSAIIENQLLAARLLNLALAICATMIFAAVTLRLLPDRTTLSLIPPLMLIFQPTFWHLCTTVNPTSWIYLLQSTGFFLLVKHRDSPRKLRTTILGFLAFSALTHWSLVLFNLPVAFWFYLYSPGIPRTSWKRQVFASVTALLLLGTVSVLFWKHNPLLHHELTNAYSGLTGFFAGPKAALGQRLSFFFNSFWAGFGWLTVPSPRIAFGLSAAITVILAGSLIFGSLHNSALREYSRLGFFVLIAGFIFILFRASADDPAVQGRYLFPYLPFIYTGALLPLLTSCRRYIRFGLLPAMVLIATTGDAAHNLGGWFRAFNWQQNSPPALVQALSRLQWLPGNSPVVKLDLGNRHARAVMGPGWYPDETAPQVWFRHHAVVFLPFLPGGDYRISVRALPYCPGTLTCQELSIMLNGSQIRAVPLEPGWNDVRIDTQIPDGPYLNELQFLYPSVQSPFEIGESGDRRKLSAGIDRIDISPLNTGHQPLPSWSLDASGFNIQLLPGTGIRFHEPGGHHLGPGVTDLEISGVDRRVLLSRDSPVYQAESMETYTQITMRHTVRQRLDQVFRAAVAPIDYFPALQHSRGLMLLLFSGGIMSWILGCFFCGTLLKGCRCLESGDSDQSLTGVV